MVKQLQGRFTIHLWLDNNIVSCAGIHREPNDVIQVE